MGHLLSPRSWFSRPAPGAKHSGEPARLLQAANNLVLHLHPASIPAPALRFTYTWGLGGIATVLVLMLALSGLLLMFHYDARVDNAYISIQAIESQVPFGSLIRGVHHWSANLLVVVTALHLLRVYFTASYKQGRRANWIIGLVLFFLALVANFTGYLLPWDQLAYWAITVSTSLIAYLPLVGGMIRTAILGGPQVRQVALSNFYALHVVFIPAVLIILMAYHFWKVRKNGGISQPIRPEQEREARVATIPHLVNVEYAAALAVVVVVLLWAMLVPAPLGSIANPVSSPNPAKAAWYFVGLQELLLHMHPLAAMGLVAVMGLALLAAPSIDRDERDIGVYFRSPLGRRSALLGAILGANVTPLLVVLDEYWIDLPGWLPNWPSFLTSGLMPWGLAVIILALVYAFLRVLALRGKQRANHSEALLGVFTFVAASLILLTVIGQFFRGQNMALVLPF